MSTHPDPLEDERLTLLGLFLETHDGLLRRLSPQLEEHGLPQGEFEALLRVARTPGGRLRMSDLAAQLSLSASGLTRLVDRLERRALAERQACPTDRRGAFVVVTPAGRRLVEEAVTGHAELIDRWFTGLLANKDLAAFEAALRTIRAVVHPGATAGATP
ncbi:MAG: MarR family transcriptional regulator [Acidimicrobiales bacterium]